MTAENESVLFGELQDDPERGDLIIGSGGVRKIRVALGNRGKSAGARVVYNYFATKERIYLLLVYRKNKKSNLTKAEINQLKILTEQIKMEIEKETENEDKENKK